MNNHLNPDNIIEILDDLEIDFALNSHHPMTHLEVEGLSTTQEIDATTTPCQAIA